MGEAHEISGFFNSRKGDRKYLASFWAKQISSFLTTGVYINPSTNLSVDIVLGMKVKLNVGKAWINGYFYELEQSPKVFVLEEAHTTLARVDRVVLRFNLDDDVRSINTFVVKGVPSANPKATPLIRNELIYELSLAEITIAPNVYELRQADIKDTRLDTVLCGIVGNAVGTVDTTGLFKQYEDYLKKQTEIFDRRGLEILNHIESIQTGSFLITDCNFDDWSKKPGCKITLEEPEKNVYLYTIRTLPDNEILATKKQDEFVKDGVKFYREVVEFREREFEVGGKKIYTPGNIRTRLENGKTYEAVITNG